MINSQFAVGVGYCFAIVSANEIRGISLSPTSSIVSVDGKAYPLYKGSSFEESQKVDKLFDKIPHRIKQTRDFLK